MFNIGWGETMVLLVAALVILGPERLPGAIHWTFGTIRKVRNYASGATQQLRDELGPEFDDLRQPLADLQRLRGMSPRSVITKHLLDGDDSLFTGNFDSRKSDAGTSSGGYDLFPGKDLSDHSYGKPEQQPLRAGERPPIDTDAT